MIENIEVALAVARSCCGAHLLVKDEWDTLSGLIAGFSGFRRTQPSLVCAGDVAVWSLKALCEGVHGLDIDANASVVRSCDVAVWCAVAIDVVHEGVVQDVVTLKETPGNIVTVGCSTAVLM